VRAPEQARLQREQQPEQQQLEPGSQLKLHLVVLLHSLGFAPQLENQELPGCLTGLQLG
jgi:hypothetical protein